ncbi:hypothetical protein KC622_01815, partial [Candidatus Dojkabacteria bacterium]|nr:hypothetical protein [Candidatus Dojkabacteria bacterium]
MLLKVLDEFSPKYIFCAFDTKKPTFRHTQFAEYKAHRKPTDKSLIAQIPLVEKVLNAFNIPVIKKEGFEADDILGTAAARVSNGMWSDYPLELLIVTGDRDLLQLIGDDVSVVLPEGSFRNLAIFDRSAVYKKYSYYPEQVIDFKAIVGDASDNIPGVKGVGQKTAIELLSKYKTLDTVYEHLQEINPRWQKLLGEGVEQAQMSKELATIDTNVDISLSLESCLMKDFNRSDVISIFERFQFRSLINKIPESAENSHSKKSNDQLSIFAGNANQQKDAKVNFKPAKVIAKSGEEAFVELLETPSNRGFVAYIGKNESDGEPFYIFSVVDNMGKAIAARLDRETARRLVPSFINGGDRETIFYNWEEAVSSGLSIDPAKVSVDLALAGYLLSSGEKGYKLEDLIYRYEGVSLLEKPSKSTTGLYAAGMIAAYNKISSGIAEFVPSEYTNKTYDRLKGKKDIEIRNGLIDVLKYLDMPISVILARMENRGVALDSKGLEESTNKLRKEADS